MQNSTQVQESVRQIRKWQMVNFRYSGMPEAVRVRAAPFIGLGPEVCYLNGTKQEA